MFEKLKNNKPLMVVWNVVYTILVIFVILLLFVVLLQRFSNNNLSLGGFRIFNIVSESMVPKYQIGDILVSKTIDEKDIKVGDDIVYLGEKSSFAGKIVTHQVINIEEENGELKIHTKGIANEEEDPVITANQVKGKIVYKIRSLSLISKIVNNLMSFYFVIFVPIVIIMFVQIRRIVSSLRENKEEKK